MRSFILMASLFLSSLSWISVSVSETQTVEVQPGEQVTLMCPNGSSTTTQTDWFRVVNRTKVSCISSMYDFNGPASYCDGFQNGKFEMSSNVTTVFLKIKRVDLSDYGLYFCGFYVKSHTVIANATELRIPDNDEYNYELDSETEEKPKGLTDRLSMILGGLTVSLTLVVTVLAVKIRKLQTADIEEPQPETGKNMSPDELNHSTLSFQAKPKRNRRRASERELETHVVYAATR
ncbi:T-cell surface glycoprotein CD8 beta chain-like [Embiotoca jacksoni]|uniref:T-cell surface glycoprotein CD8 beta chain-like n=1 Tax=Embiotoca jacksoni TaxID=100190 RepID=UPI0037037DE3